MIYKIIAQEAKKHYRKLSSVLTGVTYKTVRSATGRLVVVLGRSEGVHASARSAILPVTRLSLQLLPNLTATQCIPTSPTLPSQ